MHDVRKPPAWHVLSIRYASLFFLAAVEKEDNELIALEVIHRYVEVMDMYFGNVSVFACSVALHRVL